MQSYRSPNRAKRTGCLRVSRGQFAGACTNRTNEIGSFNPMPHTLHQVHTIQWVKPSRAGDDIVVWVDVSAADASWACEAESYFTRDEAEKQYKFVRFSLWLYRSTVAVIMPEICLDDAGQFCFSNGRHRFAWMRNNGALALPVSVAPGDVNQVRLQFGTSLRDCRVQLPWGNGGPALSL